jgi:competence protein ComEA
MYGTWEKLDKREKASLIGIYAASLALVWTLGYGWGRSSGASSPMHTASVNAQGSVEVIDLSKPSLAPAPTEPSTPAEQSPPAEVVVHVSGAVKQAGVYRLAPASRVADAIEQAGGATEHADLDALNLAEPLQDGQKIHVPRKGEASAPALASVAPSRTPRSAPQAAATATTQFPINLNTATAEQLEAIPGIGPVLAQRIIEYRQTHGRFQSVDELLEVHGIGAKRLESMRPYVTVK